MKRKKRWLYIALLIVIAVTAIAFYLYKEYNRKNEDTTGIKPDYTIVASAILREFENDAISAGNKYNDKVVATEGIVKDILIDDRGFYSLMLGDTSAMSSVKCTMDTIHNAEAAALQKGTYAIVKGICAGFNEDDLLGSDVILVRCVIDKTKNNSLK